MTLPLFVFKFPEYVYRDLTIILLGAMINWILFGILWVQVYFYFTAFPHDHRYLKLTVLLELLLETTQTIAVTNDVFKFFTVGFYDPIVINQVGTAWFSVPLLSGLSTTFSAVYYYVRRLMDSCPVGSLTQGFYCYRAAVLTKSKQAVIVISLFSMCQFGAAISVAVQTKRANLLSRVLGTDVELITIGVWGISALSCDVIISIIMTYYLKKRDTGFRETHNIIKRLIRLTIETGSITASLAGISLALVYLPGHPPYYQIAALILAKAYSNSMVAALNSRMKVTSNSVIGCPPSWNEDMPYSEPSKRNHEGIMFRRNTETLSTSDSTAML